MNKNGINKSALLFAFLKGGIVIGICLFFVYHYTFGNDIFKCTISFPGKTGSNCKSETLR